MYQALPSGLREETGMNETWRSGKETSRGQYGRGEDESAQIKGSTWL